MNRKHKGTLRGLVIVAILALTLGLTALPVSAGDYPALEGVEQIKVVFDVSLASIPMANPVFWAVKNVYEDDNVRNLARPPLVAVVFHGLAVKLISTDRTGLSEADKKALDEFAGTIREMKKQGVRLEVCAYALKVLGVDPATILPEIDKVPNGFISVVGYQAQGYSLTVVN